MKESDRTAVSYACRDIPCPERRGRGLGLRHALGPLQKEVESSLERPKVNTAAHFKESNGPCVWIARDSSCFNDGRCSTCRTVGVLVGCQTRLVVAGPKGQSCSCGFGREVD